MIPRAFLRLCAATLLFAFPVAAAPPEAGVAKRVVLVVWDGLRPDSVTHEHTPVLHALGESGVVFANHHAIYPTSTEVNGTAIATGVYPVRSGIIANNEYRPLIEPLKPVGTERIAVVRANDERTGGRHIAVPTVAEMLQRAGHRVVTAGTKRIGLLMNRRPDPALGSVTVFEGEMLPPNAISPTTTFPSEVSHPNEPRDHWTTSVLVDELWRKEVPKFSVLWLSEPDTSQHWSAPGHETALAALKSSDGCLRRVLEALDQKGLRDTTDVIVVSDHGFSTVEHPVDVSTVLAANGFNARREFKKSPEHGDVLCVGNGGSLLFYVIGRDAPTIQRLVDYLQRSEFTGLLFTRDGLEGTFPLSTVHLDTSEAADVVLSFRWIRAFSSAGVAGKVMTDWGPKAGKGSHNTFSRHDVHNTLIAAGPDFKAGVRSAYPSSNIDVAPTICWILGLKPEQRMDGRTLSEGIKGWDLELVAPTSERLEATRKVGNATWRQRLVISRAGSAEWLEEGNGELLPP